MDIIYIGTAASEGLPALFCKCPVCEDARKNMGREFRGRTGVCVNRRMMIDFPPDVYYGAARAGVDLSDIEDIVLTHAHEDHFDPYELSTRREPIYCHRNIKGEELRVWGNMRAGALLDSYVRGSKDGNGENGGLRFIYAPYFEPIETAAGITVYPLPADHDKSQECRMLLLEEKSTGARFLYGHDTGIFPVETMNFLQGRLCGLISLDCTNVMQGTERDSGHMGIKADIEMRKRLLEAGAADSNTRFICHHFSHNGFIADGRVWTQSEFEAFAAENGFTMSYDGMKASV